MAATDAHSCHDDQHGPTDVTVLLKTLSSKTSEESISEIEEEEVLGEWACHKTVLSKQSAYFSSLLGTNFSESESKTVSLPGNIITAISMEIVFQYIYHHKIESIHIITDLFDAYVSADYLNMADLGTLLYQNMMAHLHQCTCYCASCVTNIPTLFPLCRARAVQDQDKRMGVLSEKMMLVVTNDPEKSLASYWSHRPMAQLLMQLTQEVSQAFVLKTVHRVNKYNSIEALYSCYTASKELSVRDPLLSWSSSLHATLNSVQSRATRIIAHNFDFYCNQYPALMSCIDNVSYSFDFLEYLLLHILEEQMDCANAGLLYQGIACDLSSREAVAYNDQVYHILSVAKVIILHYISRHLEKIQSQGSLDSLEEEVLVLLAHDLDVRPKQLISPKHPLSKRSLFSFLIPSIPEVTLTTSEYTHGLSRYNSHSSTHRQLSLSNHMKHRKPSIKHRFLLLFKKILSQPSHHEPHRSLSSSTTHTSASASSAWSRLPHKLKSLRRTTSSPIVSINKRVRLIRRPNITVGTVLYVGTVHFGKGVWIGIELDRRVGKNDGSVDGYRYFTTSINRGIFVKPEDVSIVL